MNATRLLFFALFILSATAKVSGEVMYSYAGKGFNTFQGSAAGQYNYGNWINMSFYVAGTLLPSHTYLNGPNLGLPDLISWSATDGKYTYGPSSQRPNAQLAGTLTTDSAGQPAFWNISISEPYSSEYPNSFPVQLWVTWVTGPRGAIQTAGPVYGIMYAADYAYVSSRYGFLYSGATPNPGSWSAVALPSAVPEIDPNSLGSVLALVVGSLGLLERRRLKAA